MYRVLEGNSLYSISTTFFTSPDDIVSINPDLAKILSDGGEIHPGDRSPAPPACALYRPSRRPQEGEVRTGKPQGGEVRTGTLQEGVAGTLLTLLVSLGDHGPAQGLHNFSKANCHLNRVFQTAGFVCYRLSATSSALVACAPSREAHAWA